MKIESGARISIIGHGSWATALVGLLASKGTHVSWYVSNPDVRDGIREEGHNPKYIRDFDLCMEKIDVYDNLDDAVRDGDIIVLATPSVYLKKVLSVLSVPLSDKFIVSAVKGIVQGEYTTVLEYMRDTYSIPEDQLILISGPTHAEEVARRHLSYMTAAGFDMENTAAVAEIFTTKVMKVNTSSDVYDIEYAAILKNIYAIAAGLEFGLDLGDNFLSVLISRCVCEMQTFLETVCPCERNITDKAYLGDILVTCYSPYSRNRRFGHLIGRGFTVKSAINEMTMVSEGYYGSECIHKICADKGLSLPVVEMVYRILYEKSRPGREMTALGRIL